MMRAALVRLVFEQRPDKAVKIAPEAQARARHALSAKAAGLDERIALAHAAAAFAHTACLRGYRMMTRRCLWV